MAHVARQANVSVTTVSHVVNRTRAVAAATEEAVLAAIAATGYVPDDVVRSMRISGPRSIGFAVSAFSNSYFAELVRSVEAALSRAGYSLLLADTHDDEVQELRTMTELFTHRVAAVLLAPSAAPEQTLDYARRQGIPVVLIDRAPDRDFDQVASENIDSTGQLVSHLLDVGHTRIAMIGGRPGLSTAEERITGFKNALQHHGHPFDPTYLVMGNATAEGGRHAFTELMSLPAPPTAVVAGNNAMTIGIMQAARDLDIRIPDDIAVVGFDDFEWADLFHPRLTVMAQPLHAMGEQAADMILTRLADPGIPARTVILTPQFMHRESCGCRPASPEG
jgi:LacI family transcriptional regulator